MANETRDRGPILDAIEKLLDAAHDLARLQDDAPAPGDVNLSIQAGMCMVLLGSATIANVSTAANLDGGVAEAITELTQSIREAFQSDSPYRCILAETAERALGKMDAGAAARARVVVAAMARRGRGLPS